RQTGIKFNRTRQVRILSTQGGGISLHAIDQLMVGWPQLRPIGVLRIVAGAGVRRPRMKVARPGESLANDSRSHHLAMVPDQLAVRFFGEQKLRQSGYN